MRRSFAIATLLLLAGTAGVLARGEEVMDHISGKESGGNYAIFNQAGTTQALGRYQFLPSTFAGLGYMTYVGGSPRSWSSYSFSDEAVAAGVTSVSDLRYTDAGHSLQDAAELRYLDNSYASFSSTTRNAIGSSAYGVPVTTDGLLSVSQFLGAGGLNAWVASGFDPSALSASTVAANGGDREKLNQYLLNRMGRDAGETWVGGQSVAWNGASSSPGSFQPGMYEATADFPGFTTQRPVVIREVLPFQGTLPNLGGH